MSDNEVTSKVEEEGTGTNNDMAKEIDIFGSDSEDSDGEAGPVAKAEVPSSTNALKSIFGDDSDSESDIDKEKDSTQPDKDHTAPMTKAVSGENNMDFMFEEGEGEGGAQSSQSKQLATHAKICIPESTKISEQVHTFSLRLPNFLKMQTNPHNKLAHHESAEAAQFQGATSMIRWRHKLDQKGEVELDDKGLPVRESNARLVKWSDGSFQLLVGQEVFDSSTFPVADR
jgi:RNA polymerase-associated protein LEO1